MSEPEEKTWEGNPFYYRPNHGTRGNYPSPFEGDSQRLKEDCKTYLPRDHYDLPEEIGEWDQEDWDYFVHRNDD